MCRSERCFDMIQADPQREEQHSVCSLPLIVNNSELKLPAGNYNLFQSRRLEWSPAPPPQLRAKLWLRVWVLLEQILSVPSDITMCLLINTWFPFYFRFWKLYSSSVCTHQNHIFTGAWCNQHHCSHLHAILLTFTNQLEYWGGNDRIWAKGWS